jgi:hypothetical protein
MDEIIMKIIKAEHDAKAIVRKAQGAKDNFDMEIEAEIAAARMRGMKSAENEIAKISKAENQEKKIQLEKIEKEFKDRLETMQMADKRYHGEWVSSFLAAVIPAAAAAAAAPDKR